MTTSLVDPQRVLDYLTEHGQATLAQMAKAFGVLKLDLVQTTSVLQSRFLISRVFSSAGTPTKNYRITPKAHTRCNGKPMSLNTTYTGVDWSAATSRPGCLDHLAHPSRRGDLLVPHMPAQGIES